MSRPQQYTDDLRLAHILADSVDRVSAMRFRDRPVFSPASEVVEPVEAAPAAGTVGAVAAGGSAARGAAGTGAGTCRLRFGCGTGS